MTHKKYLAVLCTVLLVSGLVYAQDVDDSSSDEILLAVGEVKTFSAHTPQRIAIGKPEIADVSTATDKEIVVAAKAAGSTTFVFWDNFGEQNFNIRVVAENLQLVKQQVDRALKELGQTNAYSKVSDTGDKVILTGEIKSAQDREHLFTILASVKGKLLDFMKIAEEDSAVEIDVQILELNKDATNTLGFTWPGSIALTDVSGPVTSGVTGLENVFHVSRFTRSAFNVTLSALVQEGKARILSRPRLACQSGKEAELLVGGEKPVLTTQTVSGGGTGTQVEYKEYGIKLKIKPLVTGERRIKLALKVEVSDVEDAVILGTAANPTALAYPLKKRNASTELFLNNGQTMGIGGLMKQRTEEDNTKTPKLGDIPIIGALFRKKVTTIGGGFGERGNVELFIVLTPTIVGKVAPAAKSAPAEEVAATPAAPTPVVSEPPVEQKIDASPEIVDYIKLVQAKIVNAAYYPAQAKEAGWEGTVKMVLKIDFNGRLKEIVIVQPSGYKILDDAAKEAAEKQAPYPPFPPQISSQELQVEIPVLYKKE